MVYEIFEVLGHEFMFPAKRPALIDSQALGPAELPKRLLLCRGLRPHLGRLSRDPTHHLPLSLIISPPLSTDIRRVSAPGCPSVR